LPSIANQDDRCRGSQRPTFSRGHPIRCVGHPTNCSSSQIPFLTVEKERIHTTTARGSFGICGESGCSLEQQWMCH
jgi:hypothetical protein